MEDNSDSDSSFVGDATGRYSVRYAVGDRSYGNRGGHGKELKEGRHYYPDRQQLDSDSDVRSTSGARDLFEAQAVHPWSSRTDFQARGGRLRGGHPWEDTTYSVLAKVHPYNSAPQLPLPPKSPTTEVKGQ